ERFLQNRLPYPLSVPNVRDTAPPSVPKARSNSAPTLRTPESSDPSLNTYRPALQSSIRVSSPTPTPFVRWRSSGALHLLPEPKSAAAPLALGTRPDLSRSDQSRSPRLYA